MPSDAEFDRMLDAALAAYSEVEPRPGLAARVLQGLRTPRRRWWPLALVPAGAALTAAVAASLFLLPPTPPPPALLPVTAWTPDLPTVIVHAPSAPRKRSLSAHRERSPGGEVFPTPTPLTFEERALLALGSRKVPEVPELIAHGGIEPLAIPDLQIKPLPNNGE